MKSSKITSKYQASIPKEVRDYLKLNPGDEIIFQIDTDKEKVIVKRATPFDKEYLNAIQYTLTEWASEEDEENFKHLQGL